jgi:hypothetical protein
MGDSTTANWDQPCAGSTSSEHATWRDDGVIEIGFGVKSGAA